MPIFVVRKLQIKSCAHKPFEMHDFIEAIHVNFYWAQLTNSVMCAEAADGGGWVYSKWTLYLIKCVVISSPYTSFVGK